MQRGSNAPAEVRARQAAEAAALEAEEAKLQEELAQRQAATPAEGAGSTDHHPLFQIAPNVLTFENPVKNVDLC